MRTAALAPRDVQKENASITKSALLTGGVSALVAHALGFDPLTAGLLLGGGAWLWGKGKQILR